MKNWFKRKKETEYDIVTNDVPMSTVFRWYLYDTSIVEDVNEMAETIGLSRISEEGEDKEQEDSDRRMEAVQPLFPFLESMADLSSHVMTAIHVNEMLEDNPEIDEADPEVIATLASMSNLYKAVALSTLIGTIAGALELGILETNTVSSSTYIADKEEEDNE